MLDYKKIYNEVIHSFDINNIENKKSEIKDLLLGDRNPIIVKNGNLGSVILNKNNEKIFFKDYSIQQVTKELMQYDLIDADLKAKNHELIITFEDGHAYAVLQNNGIEPSYIKFDFWLHDHEEGNTLGGLLSILSGNGKCQITPFNNHLQNKAGQYLRKIDKLSLSNSQKIFYSKFSSEEFNIKHGDQVLIIPISDNQYNDINNAIISVQNRCESGELKYDLSALEEGTANCFSGIYHLTDAIKLDNYLHYYSIDQLQSDSDQAKLHALNYFYQKSNGVFNAIKGDLTFLNKLISFPSYESIYKLSTQINDILFSGFDDVVFERENIIYDKSYMFYPCELVKGDLLATYEFNHNDICVIDGSQYPSMVLLNSDGNYYKSEIKDIYMLDDEDSGHLEFTIKTTIYSIDDAHPLFNIDLS